MRCDKLFDREFLESEAKKYDWVKDQHVDSIKLFIGQQLGRNRRDRIMAARLEATEGAIKKLMTDVEPFEILPKEALVSLALSSTYGLDPFGALQVAAAGVGHSGEWRDMHSHSNHCKLDDSCSGRIRCQHGGGIITKSHWSCCGSKDQNAACPHIGKDQVSEVSPPPPLRTPATTLGDS